MPNDESPPLSPDALVARIAALEAELSELKRTAAAEVREARDAEARLGESEVRFRVLVEGAFEGLAVSVDGKIIEANHAFARLAHTTRDDVIGRAPSDFATKESVAAVLSHIAHGDESPYEITALRRDGTTFPCEVLGRNIVYQGLPARITAVRDISERKRAEAERKLLEARMRESQKLEELGMLAGGVAHDFNNLLAVILGHAGLSQRNLAVDSPVHSHIGQIRTAALRASELTKQLLTYTGRGPTRRATLDLGDVVRDIVELLRVTVSAKAKLLLSLEPDLPLIDGDAALLRQVIMNLITNASDALEGKPGEIRVRAAAVSLRAGDLRDAYADETKGPGLCTFLEVSDTGRGMEPETLRRIFDPFFTTKFAGRGLGLASVLGTVRGHHAAIRVTSEIGRGTTFTLYFPASTEVPPPEATHPDRRPPFSGTGTALVADDEPMLRRLTAEVLSSAGFAVVSAADGADAVELFRKRAKEITLVVLDLTMPRMSGTEALTAIRELDANVPVVVLSGYSESNDQIDARNPRTVFVAKPFEAAALIETVRGLMG